MATRQKTPKNSNRRALTSTQKADNTFQELHLKLVDINGKLERLERKYAQKPSEQLSSLIKQYQEQIVSIEQEIATMVSADPKLAQIERTDPLMIKPGHSLEKDYREQLGRAQETLEAELINELRAEQDKREQEWRQAERVKMDQREQRLLEMLAERQAKVEDEWQMRRKTDSAATAFAWFTEQQKILREQLHAGMQKLRQEFDRREKEHAEEVRQMLTLLEKQWSEKRCKELQKLEVDWREQELMHRERVYLRRMEGEWRAEQRSTLEQLTTSWRTELEQAQTQQLAAHIAEALPKLTKQWMEQLVEEQDAKSRSLFKQAKAEWDALLQDKLRKELEKASSSIRKETEQVLTNEITSSIASLTTSSSENLKTIQRDYAALAAAWEKKHAEALQAQKELWQTQQKKLFTELSGEIKGSVQSQFLQVKTVLESQMTQVMSNMFKQWSLQFTEEQTSKSQATFKQAKAEWDITLKETLKREADTLQMRASEGARLLQSQNEQLITSTQNKLEQKLTASFSDSLKALQRDYSALAGDWERQHADGLKTSRDQWQSQQKRLLAELSGEVKQAVETHVQQLKASIESHTSQIVPELFKQWSQKFANEQTEKIQATFKQTKAEWDRLLAEAIKQETEVMQRRASDGINTMQAQNQQSLKSLFTEATQEQQKLWQSVQSKLMKEMSASVLQSLQGQLTKYENTSTQAQSTALREMSIKVSEQIALEITQRIDTLRQEFRKDFDKYARAWQGELANQFAELGTKYTLQHQQELELLGQETRRDLVKETDITREELKLSYAHELRGIAKELEVTFAEQLKQQKQLLLEEHHKQLGALETKWRTSTNTAVGDLLKQIATAHEQQYDKLKTALAEEYRRELQAVALADGKEREKVQAVLAEKAAKSLAERLSVALKDSEATHANQLSELRSELKAQSSSEISRSIKSWHEMTKKSIDEQVAKLVNSFEEKAAKSAQDIQEKCYQEYRGRLGKMVDELVRRHKEPKEETTPNSASTSSERTTSRAKDQPKTRRSPR